jgi:hypothetical protein
MTTSFSGPSWLKVPNPRACSSTPQERFKDEGRTSIHVLCYELLSPASIKQSAPISECPSPSPAVRARDGEYSTVWLPCPFTPLLIDHVALLSGVRYCQAQYSEVVTATDERTGRRLIRAIPAITVPIDRPALQQHRNKAVIAGSSATSSVSVRARSTLPGSCAPQMLHPGIMVQVWASRQRCQSRYHASHILWAAHKPPSPTRE